jgi:hypothetical protein
MRRIGMERTSLNPIKPGCSLVLTIVITGLSVSLPFNSLVLAGPLSISPTQTNASYISQNTVGDRVNLETIYIAEEGINLGWIIRIGNIVVAVDASGRSVRILERAVNNSRGNIAEYYISGVLQGKLKRIGNTYFQYYNNAGIELGRISSIGNLTFQYSNNGGIENGKIQSIGNIPFRYYNTGVNGVKIKSIGNVYLTYDRNWNLQTISGTQPNVNIQTMPIEQWRLTIGMQERAIPSVGF